ASLSSCRSQRYDSARKTAAASLDPPPIPPAAGNLFSRCSAAPASIRPRSLSSLAARNTRLSSPSPAIPATSGPSTVSANASAGAGIIAPPVRRPAPAVDDVAVIGAQFDRLFDHLQPLVEIFAAIDPGIAEIIENQRLLGFQLQRMLQILFGALPLAGAFERDAVVVKQRPALGHADRGGAADRLLIGGDRLGEALFVAQDIAELYLRRNRLRLL